jgi:hypothetical protein
MPGKKRTPNDQVEELLSKLVAINLRNAGASQGKIARAVGKSPNWVNDFLKGIPKPKKSKPD